MIVDRGSDLGEGRSDRSAFSRDANGKFPWWMPVSDIVVGDIVYMQPTGLVYECTEKSFEDELYRFGATLRTDLSAARTADVDPTQATLDLIFRDPSVRFFVLKDEEPPIQYRNIGPC